MVGSPISHSLSPVLHLAAYEALGLTDWTYDRVEVRSGDLARYVADLPSHQIGLSVTMPGKPEALALAAGVSAVAAQTGAANTLIATPQGWYADNTDVVGLQRALAEGRPDPVASEKALLVGSGATAKSALVALRGLGVYECWVQVRSRVRPDFLSLAQQLDVVLHQDQPQQHEPLAYAVSTVPASASPESIAGFDLSGATALDVVYGSGATPWAQQAQRGGATVVDGSRMLLHQAGEQVRLMTGLDAPIAAMDAALRRARLEGQ